MGAEFNPTHEEALEKVLEAAYLIHRGNRTEVKLWLNRPNPQLGGESPMDLIRRDRLDMLVDLLRIMIADMDDPK